MREMIQCHFTLKLFVLYHHMLRRVRKDQYKTECSRVLSHVLGTHDHGQPLGTDKSIMLAGLM